MFLGICVWCLVSNIYFCCESDYLIAYTRLNYFMNAVACRPGTPNCGVGSLCGCCKWCLLLLAGWCEGIYGVWESEALAAYVVFVPFLLAGEVSTQYLTLFKCILRLFSCMSLGLKKRWHRIITIVPKSRNGAISSGRIHQCIELINPLSLSLSLFYGCFGPVTPRLWSGFLVWLL